MNSKYCIMPECPYCPDCKYGNVHYPEDFNFNEGGSVDWTCLLEKENGLNMKIKREIDGKEMEIELTAMEIYDAYIAYVCKTYEFDVEYFIENHLHISLYLKPYTEWITQKDIREMAHLFYYEHLKEYTNIYAMARVVIPYLEEKGIYCGKTAKDFIDSTEELNCI